MLLIETHVREDHIHLYGFYSSEEKSTFTLLQSVKGVGTRMSLAILSTLSPDEISYALAIKDTTAFSRVSGVGKKLAERIITELKDKYSSNYISEIPITSSAGKDSGIHDIAIDSISALVALGVNKAEAQNRINTLLAQDKNISLNELIKLALKN
jgi:Holliday junction DNA helicase RuvA